MIVGYAENLKSQFATSGCVYIS